MKARAGFRRAGLAGLVAVGMLAIVAGTASAHCDTMDGPVVLEAKAALAKGDVTPVLKWVRKDQEEEIRTAFKRTVTVRALSPEAKNLADMYFFETLVRTHRAGEGAPYEGLKSTAPEPIIAAADAALAGGSIDDLTKKVGQHVAAGIRERFEKAVEKKKHATDSVEAGREYVAAYVEYTHYLEGLHKAAMGASDHHESPAAASAGKHTE
jgi:hypothetical protein